MRDKIRLVSRSHGHGDGISPDWDVVSDGWKDRISDEGSRDNCFSGD